MNSQTINGDEDPVEVFIPSLKLKKYVTEKTAAGEKVLLRAYLDGLDEITDGQRRAAVMKLAQSACQSGIFQIVVTSREHIAGPYLEWLPSTMASSWGLRSSFTIRN